MEEQTKMEKNNATRYMPTQKKKEFQPPMAERVDLAFMDIILVFQKRIPVRGITILTEIYHEQGLYGIKIVPIIGSCKRKITQLRAGRQMTGPAKNYLVKMPKT
jgi:hypothetical protein